MARSILFLLSALGFFGIFVAPIWNGMHELTGKHLASKTLPDGTPLSSNLRIGLPFAHVYLSHLIIFFWNLFRIDEIPGATVDSALLFVPFSGAILPITMIQLVEGVRLENRGTAVSFISASLWGLLCQFGSWAAPLPIYLFFLIKHLRKNPTPGLATGSIPLNAAFALIFAQCFGYIVPTLLAFQVPHSSPQLKQDVIALWQLYPLWIAVLYYFTLWIFDAVSWRKKAQMDVWHVQILTTAFVHGGFLLSLLFSTSTWLYFLFHLSWTDPTAPRYWKTLLTFDFFDRNPEKGAVNILLIDAAVAFSSVGVMYWIVLGRAGLRKVWKGMVVAAIVGGPATALGWVWCKRCREMGFEAKELVVGTEEKKRE